jgi:outer membrane protein OmpA-like peptidoglycan-associated protein
VYFASGSSALDEDGRASVQRAARTLSAGLAARVALSGYVDASGNAATNAELAKHRALAVREALLAAGVPAEAVDLRKPQQITAGGSPDEARRVDLLLQR